jgi:hypothetical protein
MLRDSRAPLSSLIPLVSQAISLHRFPLWLPMAKSSHAHAPPLGQLTASVSGLRSNLTTTLMVIKGV